MEYRAQTPVGWSRTTNFLVASAALGCTGCETLDLRESGGAIIAGQPSPDDVGIVAVTLRSASCEPAPIGVHCTATLVAPRVVITAAHCLENNPPNALAVFFGPVLDDATILGDDVLVPVSGGRAHPGFDAATHANDIAVLILERAAPAGITPIALQRQPLPDISGETVRLVGYGIDAITSTTVGTRRSGTALVTEVGADDLRMAPGPAMSCQGDSGGPVLYGAPGAEQLIGVTTWGDAACADFGVAARVDRYIDTFVQPILDEAAASPMRRAFDPSERLCRATCATDADCPLETVCFGLEGAAKHCIYHGLPAGELGDACTSATECEDACVRVGTGCRRLVPCEPEPGDHCAPPDDGCGCAAPASPSSLLVLVVLAMACAARRTTRSSRRTASYRDARAPRRGSRQRR